MPLLEWDEAKRRGNLAKHGVDFVEAFEVLDDPHARIAADDRRDYGEARFVVLGAIRSGAIRVLVVTPRASATRVISLRPANARERSLYARGKIGSGGSA